MEVESFSSKADILTWSPSQKRALEALGSDQNVFLTGEAGSGKSTVVHHFMKSKDPKKFPILASTGSAAVLVGGTTFHSFMGIGILEGGVEKTVQRAFKDKRLLKRLKTIDGFIIDEVSMLPSPVLSAAERICQMARGRLDMPWGGLRVIAVGDFSQLPPVERGGKSWAFKGEVWKRSNFVPVVLEQNMRTQHGHFLNVLNNVRQGVVTEDVSQFLNSRLLQVNTNFPGTRLFPRVYQVDQFNLAKLKELPGEMLEFESSYKGLQRHVDRLKKYSPLPETIYLKEGALVMLRQNDPKKRWVNGTTGRLIKADDDELTIELLSGRTIKLEKSTFSLLDTEGEPVAAVENFPISLAYAVTIHKSQGMTLDRLMVDLYNLWEPGHAYVALSRVREPENLFIHRWDKKSIKADPDVLRYYECLQN